MSKLLNTIVAAGGVVVVALSVSGPRADDAPMAGAYSDDGVPRQTVLERKDNGHFYAHALVNDLPVQFVVDTGASTVALTVADARRLGIPFSEREFTVIATGASGPVIGVEVVLDRVSLDGKRVADVRAMICDGLEISLLGQNYLSRIGSMVVDGDQMTLG